MFSLILFIAKSTFSNDITCKSLNIKNPDNCFKECTRRNLEMTYQGNGFVCLNNKSKPSKRQPIKKAKDLTKKVNEATLTKSTPEPVQLKTQTSKKQKPEISASKQNSFYSKCMEGSDSMMCTNYLKSFSKEKSKSMNVEKAKKALFLITDKCETKKDAWCDRLKEFHHQEYRWLLDKIYKTVRFELSAIGCSSIINQTLDALVAQQMIKSKDCHALYQPDSLEKWQCKETSKCRNSDLNAIEIEKKCSKQSICPDIKSEQECKSLIMKCVTTEKDTYNKMELPANKADDTLMSCKRRYKCVQKSG